eukprot:gene11260-12440_t
MGDENCQIFSFAEALKHKYTEYEPKLFDSIKLSPKRRASYLNQLSHEQRQILALDGCKVGNAGNPGEIAKICPNLKELDLASNSLSCWEQIFCIVSQLPYLLFLNLSGNPLDSNYEEDKLCEFVKNNPMPKLQKLVLNNTKVDLKFVLKLLEIFPTVEELHLSLNAYGRVIEWPKNYPNVKTLHFNRNELENWEDVIRVGKLFPSLKILILCENPVKEINFEKEVVLHKLSTLSLSKTEINNWKSIDEIKKLPALEDLRLVGVPLAENEAADNRRKLLVSRLPNVKKLNGSAVNCQEREDAERMFIRYHMDSTNPPKRYHELVEKHGKLDRLAEVDMSKKEIAKISLLVNGDELMKIVVDLSVDTRSFRQEIRKKLGLGSRRFHMFYCHFDEELGQVFKEQMDTHLYKRLYTYQMKDGDEILVVI